LNAIESADFTRSQPKAELIYSIGNALYPSFPRKRESHKQLSLSDQRRVTMADHPGSSLFFKKAEYL
jgi:hypothetical protein